MHALTAALVGLSVLALASPAAAGDKKLEVVESVDLERYAGTWYEIARYPNRFEKNCYAVTATYELRDDGKVSVTNRCREGAVDGPVRDIEGVAFVKDEETRAKLAVQFFWPFRGAYWIIDLDPDYQWAVVGHPKRRYLWVLSRTPTLDDEIYDGIIERLEAVGYDPERILKTPQTHNDEP